MSLKLFRSTGYSSILSPGETRVATHPGWIILVTSVWAGFACNVALWRVGMQGAPGLAHALMTGTLVAAGSVCVLSLFGWHKTLKPAATAVLLLAALSACAAWSQASPAPGSAQGLHLPIMMLPSWASLLRWQVSALLVFLAAVPMMWLWGTHVRRLPGPAQLRVNLTGMIAGAALAGASAFLLYRGLI